MHEEAGAAGRARSGAGGARAAVAVALALCLVPALGGALAPAAGAARRHGQAPAGARSSAVLRLGGAALTRCQSHPLGYCGTLQVPLDPSSPQGPLISIAYEFLPASSGAAKGTVVPVEGGPGYPSIGSVSYSSGGAEAGYAAMYGPLLERWNMLVVDNRGTGASTPLRCAPLQSYPGPTGTAAFAKVVGECGEQLDTRWRYPDGTPVHASDLFTSAAAAQDLAAVIRTLGVGRVDLYGDSYGSFFAQVFAARYPTLLRSLILDSTYLASGLDPWYRSTVESMPADFQAACARAPACTAAEPEPVWTRIASLAAALRSKPASGVVPGPAGKPEKVRMDAVGLVDLLSDAAEDPQVYRALDAAARALLEDAEAAPLLRLYAQRLASDEAYFGLPSREYSVEDYFAVGCLDYPQLFAMTATPAERSAQLAAVQAGLPAATFSPFTTAEWLAQDENTEAYTGCVDWPAPAIAQPPLPGPPPLLPAGSKLPVLVLGGELDTWTPPVDVPKVLAEVGGRSRFIELANSTHVVGEGGTPCASQLVRAFVERPSLVGETGETCASSVPAIHSVGAFAPTLSAVSPLEAAPGDSAPATALRLAAAAVQTAGDAVARRQATEAAVDHGLHGGTVTATRGGVLTLHGDRLIPGVPVSGTVTVTPAALPEDGMTAVATLTAKGEGLSAQLTATWTTSGSGAVARVAGQAAGASVTGTMPAP